MVDCSRRLGPRLLTLREIDDKLQERLSRSELKTSSTLSRIYVYAVTKNGS